MQQPSVDIDSIQSTSRAIGNHKNPKHIENQKFFQVFLYAAYTPMWPLVSRTTTKTRACMPMCNNDFSTAVAMTNCASKWLGKHKLDFNQ